MEAMQYNIVYKNNVNKLLRRERNSQRDCDVALMKI